MAACKDITPPGVPENLCPVEGVIPLFDSICADVLTADNDRDDDLFGKLTDLRDQLSARITGLNASSVRGAALQIALAFHWSELTRGMATQQERDAAHDQLEGLLASAFRVFGGAIPANIQRTYVPREARP